MVSSSCLFHFLAAQGALNKLNTPPSTHLSNRSKRKWAFSTGAKEIVRRTKKPAGIQKA